MKRFYANLLRFIVIVAVLVTAVLQPQSPVYAAATSITPLTWNVIGLDSNLVTVGPNHFPVGARVCGTGTVTVTFNWEPGSDATYINLRPGTSSSLILDLGATSTCKDAYFEVEVLRDSSAYNHTRGYYITTGSLSTPRPRELFVEHLISQSRNSVLDIQYRQGSDAFVSVANQGALTLYVGETYDIKLVGKTATNGYEQIEHFINFPNTIFQVLAVSSTYSVGGTTDMLYTDGCIWVNDPNSLAYRSCVSTGKAGGDVSTTYTVKILSVPSINPEPLSTLIYDFSGSSYHYNADYDVSTRFANILSSPNVAISKSFTPTSIIPGGKSEMTIRITNPDAVTLTGVNFVDVFPTSPGAMTTHTDTTRSTTNCGSPTLVAPYTAGSFSAGAASIGFSGATIAPGATCVIKFYVTAPTASATPYTNTTNNLFLKGTTPGTGTDTGKSASAQLVVETNPLAQTCGITMAQWTVPTAATNPPDASTPSAGYPSTKAANITTASAYANVPGSTSVQTTGGFGTAPSGYWETHGYKTLNQFVTFRVTTKNYSGVVWNFYMDDPSPNNGPSSIYIDYSTDGTTFTNHYVTIPKPVTGWINYSYDLTGLTSLTGDTYFRVSGLNDAKNDNTGAGLNFDQITFTGCSVFPPPTLQKSFTTDPITVNSGTSLLTFTVGNNYNTYVPTSTAPQNLTGITFSDTLPSGLELVVDGTHPVGGTCTGTVGASNGGTTVSLSGQSLTAGSTCTVTVYVKGTTLGWKDNITGFIDSTESDPNKGSSGYGRDDITVIGPPIISKVFGTGTITQYAGPTTDPEETTTLTFTINNPNVYAMSSVAFSDALPSGVEITAGSSSACGGGTLSQTDSNPDVVSLSGGSLAAGASCSFSVNVIGSTTGTKNNTTGTVSGTVLSTSLTGNTASASLIVVAKSPAISLMKQVSTSNSGPWQDAMITTAGTNLWYKFTVENTGTAPLSSISLTDDTFSPSCTWSTLQPYESATCIAPDGTAQAGGKLNTATVQGTYNSTTVTDTDKASYGTGSNYGHLPVSNENAAPATGNYAHMNITASGGGMHLTKSTVRLGATVPTESDGVNASTFTAESAEDGVWQAGTWKYGTVASGNGGKITTMVTCPSDPCYLNIWIDWGKDGIMDPGDLAISQAVNGSTSIQTFSFNIPGGTSGNTVANGDYYVRARLYEKAPEVNSPVGVARTDGAATLGELEDHKWTLNGGTSTPVTVSYFRAQRQGGTVNFEWSTSTETANVGFNIYVEDQDGILTRINDDLIASKVTDSLERQDYSFSASAAGNSFYIEDVNILGETRKHGSFQLGEPYGNRFEEDKIDHASINAEHAAQFAAQQNAIKKNMKVPVAALQAPSGNQPVMQLSTSLNLKVNKTGLYRVTYEMLRDAGLDLAGVPIAKIALTNRGQMVPVYVEGNGKFGPGSFIEFYGQALDTLYTDTNIYTLQVSQSPADRIQGNSASIGAGLEIPAAYTETVTVNNQRAYSDYAQGSDPWYEKSMLVYKIPKTWSFPFQINNLSNTTASPQTLRLVVWGATDWNAIDPDHHLVVKVNGVTVADERFNGIVEKIIQVTLPPGTLREGANSLDLVQPGDTAAQWDMVNLDQFSIFYPSAYQAVNGRLAFSAAAKAFRVSNLPSANVVVYRLEARGLARLGTVKTQKIGATYTATFAGSNQSATYLVSTGDALYAPSLEAVQLAPSLDQPAKYLIIAHPDFIDGLQPLIQARQVQGLSVSVVNVNDIYTQYSYGIFDPQAIKDYISHAARNLGVEYVLLVGGDTYDYRNFLGKNSISFIPSLYIATGPIARYVPVDPLYADIDGNYVPDLAIGRFPVRTRAELALLVNKTLAYQAKNYGRTAVFSSDKYDGVASYKNISNSFAASLPYGWNVKNIYLDDTSLTAARQQLLSAMNDGTALVSYTGHSGSTVWNFSSFFTVKNAAALTNAGRPFVAFQWGCWNNYYVDPINNSLVQSLLFSGDQGAAATFGAVTLTDSESEYLLGQLFLPRLASPGMPMGIALRDAKLQLALSHPDLIDVLLGWNLMGDPALVIEP